MANSSLTKFLFTRIMPAAVDQSDPASSNYGPLDQRCFERLHERIMRRKYFVDALLSEGGKYGDDKVRKHIGDNAAAVCNFMVTSYCDHDKEGRPHATVKSMVMDLIDMMEEYPFMDPEWTIGTFDTGVCSVSGGSSKDLGHHRDPEYESISWSGPKLEQASPGCVFKYLFDSRVYLKPERRKVHLTEGFTPSSRTYNVPKWYMYYKDRVGNGGTYHEINGSRVDRLITYLYGAYDNLHDSVGVSYILDSDESEWEDPSKTRYVLAALAKGRVGGGGTAQTHLCTTLYSGRYRITSSEEAAHLTYACPYVANYWYDHSDETMSVPYACEEGMKLFVPPSIPPVLRGMWSGYPPKDGWIFESDSSESEEEPESKWLDTGWYPNGLYSAMVREMDAWLDRMDTTVIPVDSVFADFSISVSTSSGKVEDISESTTTQTVNKKYQSTCGSGKKAVSYVDDSSLGYVTNSKTEYAGRNFSTSMSGYETFSVDTSVLGAQLDPFFPSSFRCRFNVDERFSEGGLDAGPGSHMLSDNPGYTFGIICHSPGGSWSGDLINYNVVTSDFHQTSDTRSESSVRNVFADHVRKQQGSSSVSATLSNITPVSSFPYGDIRSYSMTTSPNASSSTLVTLGSTTSSRDNAGDGTWRMECNCDESSCKVTKKVTDEKTDPTTTTHTGYLNPIAPVTESGVDRSQLNRYRMITRNLARYIRTADLYAVIEASTTSRYETRLMKSRKVVTSEGTTTDDSSLNTEKWSATYRKKLVKVGTMGSDGSFDGTTMDMVSHFIEEGSAGGKTNPSSDSGIYQRLRNGTYAKIVVTDSGRTEETNYTWEDPGAPYIGMFIRAMFLVIKWDFDRDIATWDSDYDSSSESD